MTTAPPTSSTELSADERGAALEVFAQALRREAHVLQERPELLWQQLYNRLQWEEPAQAVLAPSFEERARADARPWLHTRTPFGEPAALLVTFRAKGNWVRVCAVNGDASLMLSVSGENTLTLWDPRRGRELQTLVDGSDSRVYACALSPDGHLALSADSGGLKPLSGCRPSR